MLDEAKVRAAADVHAMPLRLRVAYPALVENGLIAARSFSWERVARLHDEVHGELT